MRTPPSSGLTAVQIILDALYDHELKKPLPPQLTDSGSFIVCDTCDATGKQTSGQPCPDCFNGLIPVSTADVPNLHLVKSDTNAEKSTGSGAARAVNRHVHITF